MQPALSSPTVPIMSSGANSSTPAVPAESGALGPPGREPDEQRAVDPPAGGDTAGEPEREALLPADGAAAAARVEVDAAPPGDTRVPAYMPPGMQGSEPPPQQKSETRAPGSTVTILVKNAHEQAHTPAADDGEEGDEGEDDPTAEEEGEDSAGALERLRSGVTGAVKGVLVPGSGAEGAEKAAAEEPEEEEESRGKMICMTVATISK